MCQKRYSHCQSSIFLTLDRTYKHLLFIILIGCDSVEPAGPNKLGTEPSFKSKRFVNPCIELPEIREVAVSKMTCLRAGQVDHSRPTLSIGRHYEYVVYTVRCSRHRSGIQITIDLFRLYRDNTFSYRALLALQLCRLFTFTYSYITHCMKGNIRNGIIGAL